MTVTDQVNFLSAGCRQNGLDLTRQLFAPQFGAVSGGDLADVDLSTAAAQLFRNAIPVAIAGYVVKAEQAVGQDDGITGFGVGVVAIEPVEPTGLGWRYAGAQQQGEHGA